MKCLSLLVFPYCSLYIANESLPHDYEDVCLCLFLEVFLLVSNLKFAASLELIVMCSVRLVLRLIFLHLDAARNLIPHTVKTLLLLMLLFGPDQ